jgi:hypothetical protein
MATSDYTSFVLAADNHNIGNTGTSWLDPETWALKFGNAGRLAGVSILSGVNSFYNTGAAVANWLGADVEQNDTSNWISAIDSDLGAYYRQNKETADLTGFILGSLIPGLGGIKIFNAGQVALKTAAKSGFIGSNMGKALGLLTPDTQKYVNLAIKEINASTSATKLLNANTTKALASGVWQNTLESAAFEMVVQATMFKSPVLENQDIFDIASNVVLGGVIGGTIMGAVNSAKLFGTLSAARKQEDLARMPFQARPSFAPKTSATDKIIELAYDSDMAATPVRIFDMQGKAIDNNFSVNGELYNTKINKNFLDIRTNINELAKGDLELGNIVANMSTPIKDFAGKYEAGYSQQYFNNFSGAVDIVRINKTTRNEILQARAAKGTQVKEDYKPVQSRYVELIGENVGRTSPDAPLVPSLGDIFENKKQILGQVKKYDFKVGKLWNAVELKGPKAHFESEARHIWANLPTTKLGKNQSIHAFDIPLLERAYKDSNLDITIVPETGAVDAFKPQNKEQLWKVIKESKLETQFRILEGMIKKGDIPVEQGTVVASKIANVKTSYIEGIPSNNEFDDMLAYQSSHAAYLKGLQDRGLEGSLKEAIDPLFLPKYAKIVYATEDDLSATTENILDAITFYKEKQKIYTDQAKNVTAYLLGNLHESLPDITDTALLQANRGGSGAGLFSFENSNYGTLGSSMAWIGSVTRQAELKARENINYALQGSLSSLAQNAKAAIEFDSINQKVLRSGKLWKFDGDARYLYSVEKNAEIDPDIIPIVADEVLDVITDTIKVNGKNTESYKLIRSVQGHTDEKMSDIFRPVYPDLKQYPHFAFVKDPQVTGNGHTTLLHAASEKELSALIDKVPPNYRVVTKTDAEEFFKARGEYEYSRTLHENYINHDLASKGVFSSFFVKTDPEKIANDILQQSYRQSDTLVKEIIRLRYAPQFDFLEDLGKTYARVATSKFASNRELIEKTTDNPYFNYIKTALNISKISENHLIYGFNKLLDESVSKVVGAYRTAFAGMKSKEELDSINAMLDRNGIKPAYYDSALNLLVNHQAPKGELTKFVRKANSLLSLFTLGLDPLNALNNAIGSNILRMTELRHLTKAIQAGDSEIAGELSKLAKIKLPGTGDEVFAPTKLVQKAIENFWKDDGKIIAKYKDRGYIVDRVEQLKLLVDDFTLKGTETVKELNTRLDGAFAKAKELAESGESITGNKLAEEFNRFISANVMDQITDIAVKKGLMNDSEARAYINTFVNRVEGNTVAAQRPLIFQGPIGQAIGLFQSYQFNLLQQLFRYVSEGSKKDIAMLLGLQSTLYGLQSLPAFQFMNTHIVGQLSGNKEHRDAYDAVYGATGRTAGDFILYGLPSNLLQANIYSRGDINPRQITVLPTNLQEIPIVAGWGKFFGSMKETVSKISNGANVWESLLQGVEHNGISRPLAGLAQVLQSVPGGQVYSTSNQGSILGSNDLFAWASAVRLAGGRPLDEAITNDALFRVRTYEAARRNQMKSFAEVVKSTMIVDETATQEQLMSFAQKYAELGGKQAGFNRWMMDLYKSSNVSQSQQIQASLTNPFSYKMQLLMGGGEND